MNTNNQISPNEQLRFEQDWIAALKQNPDDANCAEDWLEAQAWSKDFCPDDLS